MSDELILFKEVETKGCVMEDGGDTRKTTIQYYLIPEGEEENYKENLVSNYESQDYSYRFESKEIIRLPKMDWYEIYKIMQEIDKEGAWDICREIEEG